MLKMRMNPLLIWILVNKILPFINAIQFWPIYYLSIHNLKSYNLEEPSMLVLFDIYIYTYIYIYLFISLVPFNTGYMCAVCAFFYLFRHLLGTLP